MANKPFQYSKVICQIHKCLFMHRPHFSLLFADAPCFRLIVQLSRPILWCKWFWKSIGTHWKRNPDFCQRWEALALCTLLLSGCFCDVAPPHWTHSMKQQLCSWAAPGAQHHPETSVHSSSSLVAAPQQDQGCIKEVWVPLSAREAHRSEIHLTSPAQANPGQSYHCISMKTFGYKKPIIIFAFLI